MKTEKEALEIGRFLRSELPGITGKPPTSLVSLNQTKLPKDIRLTKQETFSKEISTQSDLDKTAVHKKPFRINSKPSQSNVSVGTTTNNTVESSTFERQLSGTSRVSQASVTSQTESSHKLATAQKPLSRGGLARTRLPALEAKDIGIGNSGTNTPGLSSAGIASAWDRRKQELEMETAGLLGSGSQLATSQSRGQGSAARMLLSEMLPRESGPRLALAQSPEQQTDPDSEADLSGSVQSQTRSLQGTDARQATRETSERSSTVKDEQGDKVVRAVVRGIVGPRVGGAVVAAAKQKRLKEQFRSGMLCSLESGTSDKGVGNANLTREESLLAKILQGRIKEDNAELEVFLERVGLMKYYDRLWELGVDSLAGLAEVGVEEWNGLRVPAGTQIKLDRELRKLGIFQGTQPKEVGLATDDMAHNTPSVVVVAPNRTENKGLFSKFGIKMNKVDHGVGREMSEDKHKPTGSVGVRSQGFAVCAGGTQTDDVGDIPLNVDMDTGPVVRVVEIKAKPAVKGILKPAASAVGGNLGPLPRKAQSPLSKKRAQFATDDQHPVQQNFLQVGVQQGAGLFSFASLGSGVWTLPTGDVETADRENSPAADKLISASQQQPDHRLAEAVRAPKNHVAKYQSRKVSCYCCYKTFDELEAMTHRSLPNRFFCGRECLTEETQKLLTTCALCFKVLTKTEGLPCRDGWTCSVKCLDKAKEAAPPSGTRAASSGILVSRAAEELVYQSRLRGESQPGNKRQASVGTDDRDEIDLDFGF